MQREDETAKQSRSLLPKRANSNLAIPIKTANRQGPIKSPKAFETPSPLSAKAEAHCDIASSDAPASIISAAKIQKLFSLNSAPNDSPFCPPSKDGIGTKTT